MRQHIQRVIAGIALIVLAVLVLLVRPVNNPGLAYPSFMFAVFLAVIGGLLIASPLLIGNPEETR